MTTTVTATHTKKKTVNRIPRLYHKNTVQNERNDVDDIDKGFRLISSLITTSERKKKSCEKIGR